jgi:UDP-N-acetylglucosamine:LPS N-acetylglucosamine transferase
MSHGGGCQPDTATSGNTPPSAEAAAHRGGRRPKVLAVASRGGHWIQLLRLREAYDDAEVVFVTTVPEYRQTIGDARLRVVIEATRERKLRLALMALQMLWILLRERPDAIVTTGAAPGFAAVRLGRLLGIRTLWIDSIANAEELSLSGRLAARHADAVLTQWAHLARPGAIEYRGAVV